jgi:outer membrane autotransporter protein
LNYDVSEKVSPFAGASWEHEFDGKTRAKVNDVELEAPSMEGDTGIFELGVSLKPFGSNARIELGAQGYAGKREGLTGSALLKLEF